MASSRKLGKIENIGKVQRSQVFFIVIFPLVENAFGTGEMRPHESYGDVQRTTSVYIIAAVI